MKLKSRRLPCLLAVVTSALIHSASVVASDIDECDNIAAHPDDPERKNAGLPFEKIPLPEALSACKKAMEQGPENSRLIYQYGRTLLASGKQAEGIALILSSAAKGYPQAVYTLGLVEHRKTPANLSGAAEKYRRAAELGHTKAMLLLGAMYLEGKGAPPDAGQALSYFRRAAEMGDAEAQTEVGVIYLGGFGVLQNYSEAARWFATASERDPFASYVLGLMYMNGEGVIQDIARAFQLFRRAVEKGSDEAMGVLGTCYLYGWGVAEDRSEALRWLRKAAEKNDREGMRYLGNALVGPERSAEEVSEGLLLLTNAAEVGDPIAADNLASIYYYGHGVPVDKRKAAYWQDEAEQIRSVYREKPRPLKIPPHRAVLPLG